VLVASYASYERYQRKQAETWEHMALLRARAIAGEIDGAQQLLERVREPVLSKRSNPWEYIAELRERVETERSVVSKTTFSLKTGRGGLMDVDFLASGGMLEQPIRSFPTIPSVPAMLKAAVAGADSGRLLADYRLLRLVESRARWAAGRAVDDIQTDDGELDLLAELVEPGSLGVDLRGRLDAARDRIRASFESVIAAGSISALTT
jgi:glutamate-ammonia-ligase adenylyltransferase